MYLIGPSHTYQTTESPAFLLNSNAALLDAQHYFPHLKCLYFEGNAVESLDGLQTNTELVSLYLHENCIRKMEHLNNLVNLRVLNLSDNCIS